MCERACEIYELTFAARQFGDGTRGEVRCFHVMKCVVRDFDVALVFKAKAIRVRAASRENDFESGKRKYRVRRLRYITETRGARACVNRIERLTFERDCSLLRPAYSGEQTDKR